MSDKRQSFQHIYRVTCPLLKFIQVSTEGDSWENRESEPYVSKFSRQECIEKLMSAVKQYDGQNLPVTENQDLISKINLFIDKTDCVEFYIHSTRALKTQEMLEARSDILDNLAGSWGEEFENFDFSLYTSDWRTDEDISLTFGFDYESLSDIEQYDGNTMRDLAEIQHYVEMTKKSP